MKFQISTFRPNVYYDVIFDDANGNSYAHLKIFIDHCLPKVEEYIKGVHIIQIFYIISY